MAQLMTVFLVVPKIQKQRSRPGGPEAASCAHPMKLLEAA